MNLPLCDLLYNLMYDIKMYRKKYLLYMNFGRHGRRKYSSIGFIKWAKGNLFLKKHCSVLNVKETSKSQSLNFNLLSGLDAKDDVHWWSVCMSNLYALHWASIYLF